MNVYMAVSLAETSECIYCDCSETVFRNAEKHLLKLSAKVRHFILAFYTITLCNFVALTRSV